MQAPSADVSMRELIVAAMFAISRFHPP